tara:strand:- start:40 stop:483 length:444 start_codon:yes stop_codon:yes gene_type:complete
MSAKITKKNMLDPDVFESDTDPEKLRVASIIKSITSHLSDTDEIGYHFNECDGHDDKHFDKLMADLPLQAKWHTIYDSCYFPVFDGGSYSMVKVAYVPDQDFYYLAVSLGGSLGSSALTEYFKVPLVGKWTWSALEYQSIISKEERL